MDKKIIREIIDEINLPKQILDKTSNFFSQLCGPSINEVGQLFADKIRYRRMANQINVFAKTMELLEKNNLEPKNIKGGIIECY